MKKLWQKLKCKLGFHEEGYPKGLINSFGSGYRIDYYKCKHCNKNVHWSTKVDY